MISNQDEVVSNVSEHAPEGDGSHEALLTRRRSLGDVLWLVFLAIGGLVTVAWIGLLAWLTLWLVRLA